MKNLILTLAAVLGIALGTASISWAEPAATIQAPIYGTPGWG